MQIITANWPTPPYIHAFTTTRLGGESVGPFAGFNLGLHVNDEPAAVLHNRSLLQQHLPSEALWLHQTHSTRAINALDHQTNIEADACFSSAPGKVCTVMTADCLPILLCHHAGKEVAAIHAGWRGLAAGIVENTLQAMRSDNSELMAWLGPAISVEHYEIGAEVREQFLQQNPAYETCFHPHGDRYMANLYQIARLCLQAQNVEAIYGGDHCTFEESDLFFSHRRDSTTGRMASLIWIADK